MTELQPSYVQPNNWQALKTFTTARIALGSTGVSLPTNAALQLRLAHAQAKDAVYSIFAKNALQDALEKTARWFVPYTAKPPAATNTCSAPIWDAC